MTGRAARAAALALLAWTLGLRRTLPRHRVGAHDRSAARQAYKATAYFPDGKLMQAPPAGTIPTSRRTGPQPLMKA